MNCGICKSPTRNAYVCTGCAYRLDGELAAVSDWHGLAWDVDLAAARQVHLGDPGPAARSAERAEPLDTRAALTRRAATRALLGVADRIAAETYARRLGPTCRNRRCGHGSCTAIRTAVRPPTTLAGLAAWLRPRVGWLRHHPDGPAAVRTLLRAVKNLRHTVDLPADRVYAGPCSQCERDLYARLGATTVTCNECELTWDLEPRRAWLLRQAEDVLGTATEIARAVSRLSDAHVTSSVIRGYALRGRLLSRGRQHTGRRDPLYRVGDVVALVTHGGTTSGPVCRRVQCRHSSCADIRATYSHDHALAG